MKNNDLLQSENSKNIPKPSSNVGFFGRFIKYLPGMKPKEQVPSIEQIQEIKTPNQQEMITVPQVELVAPMDESIISTTEEITQPQEQVDETYERIINIIKKNTPFMSDSPTYVRGYLELCFSDLENKTEDEVDALIDDIDKLITYGAKNYPYKDKVVQALPSLENDTFQNFNALKRLVVIYNNFKYPILGKK